MKLWIVQAGEPVAGIAGETRMGRCNHLVRHLTARGHDVVWWTSAFHHFQKRFSFDSDQTIDKGERFKVRVLHASPSYRHNVSLARLIQQKRLAKRFAEASRNESPPDLIYSCLPIPELCSVCAERASRDHVPLVVDIRDPWPDVYLLAVPKRFRRLLRTLLTPEYRRIARILHASSAIVAVSESYLRWGLDLAGRPSGTMDGVFNLGTQAHRKSSSGPMSENVRSLRLRPTSTKVVFSGSLGRTYDLQTVIKAAAELLARRLDIQIIIAGSGPDEPALRNAARNLDNVVFTGWLDQGTLSELMQMCHVGLAAYSADATQSLPNKVFDYMAAGLPQVGSLKGEAADLLVREGVGIPYPAGSVSALTDTLEKLHKNRSLRDEMAARAQSLFESKFTSDAIYSRLAEHLENIVSAHRRQLDISTKQDQ